MSRPARSLARRTVLSAVAGAIVVAVVGAALAVPLLRGVSTDQAHDELVRTVEALVSSPRVSAQLLVREQRVIGPDDRRYAVVSADGSVVGEAGNYLTAPDIEVLLQHGSISTSRRVDGTTYLIEGRALRGALAGRDATIVAVQPVAGQSAVTRSLIRRLLLALLAGLLAASVFAVVLARRTALPVREAAIRAHRLAVGERGLPAPAASSIAEVDEMTEALTALDIALAGSEARQREFLLSVSHELRTPLTALRGYAEALRDGAVDPGEITEIGEILTVETERLDRFIADLLALARLEADDFRLEISEVDLTVFVAAVLDGWRGRAQQEAIVLTGTSPQEQVTVLTDPARLRQIVDGLVENALRATPSGGEVQVRVSVNEGSIDLEVVDNGPGLAPGDHEHAFDRGYLRDRYAADRQVGTGLGLSIAHRLSSRLSAELTAHPAPGGGTLMRLRLRRQATPQRP